MGIEALFPISHYSWFNEVTAEFIKEVRNNYEMVEKAF